MANIGEWVQDLRGGIEKPILKIIPASASALEVVRPICESMYEPDLFLWTWTIGIEQSSELLRWQQKGVCGSVWAIMDSSIKKRLPKAHNAMSELKGGMRFASTHCKIYIVKSKTACISVLSSANMNKNNRYEFYYITGEREINGYILTEFRTLYDASKG